MRKFLQLLFKFFLFFSIIFSLAMIVISLFYPEMMKEFVKWMELQIKNLGFYNYFLAFGISLIESIPVIGGPFPGRNIIIFIGGFFGKNHIFFTIFLASVGAMIGNFVGFWLGQKYGQKIIENYGEWIGIGKTEQKIMESQIAKNGFWYIVLGKFHEALRTFVPFIAGISKMSNKKFWLYNGIGSVIWATVLVVLWIFFADNYEVILDNFGKIMMVILTLIIFYIFFFKKEAFKKYLADKNREIEEKIQKQQALKK